MTKLSLRELKKQRTRAAIVECALRLFRENGYNATTCEQIAAAAEVSPATFFRYFPTKEDVVLYDDYDPLFVDIFTRRPADEPLMVAIRRAVVEGLSLVLATDEDSILDRVRLMMSVPALRARIYEQQKSAEATFAEALATRMRLEPTDLRVRVVAAAIASAAMVAAETWLETGGSLAQITDAAIEALTSSMESP